MRRWDINRTTTPTRIKPSRNKRLRKMTDERIQQTMDYYAGVSSERNPLVDTGREVVPLSKRPDNLDFSKTIGGTTYIVRSHFNQNVDECLLAKVSRLLFGELNTREGDDE